MKSGNFISLMQAVAGILCIAGIMTTAVAFFFAGHSALFGHPQHPWIPTYAPWIFIATLVLTLVYTAIKSLKNSA